MTGRPKWAGYDIVIIFPLPKNVQYSTHFQARLFFGVCMCVGEGVGGGDRLQDCMLFVELKWHRDEQVQ